MSGPSLGGITNLGTGSMADRFGSIKLQTRALEAAEGWVVAKVTRPVVGSAAVDTVSQLLLQMLWANISKALTKAKAAAVRSMYIGMS